MKLFRFLLDFIAPKKCYSCKKYGKYICEDCFGKFNNFEEICYICKTYSKKSEIHIYCNKENTVFYDKILVLKHYKNFYVKRLIKDGKFYNKKEILEEFSYYLYKKFIENCNLDSLDKYIIVSVPSYFSRKLKRGYNSSEVLSRYFGQKSKLFYNKNIIKKIKNTKQQSKLSRKNRIENLQDSFKMNEKYISKIKNKNILLIDDVISTGTTINEISKILKNNGAKNIIGLIIASN